MSEASPQGRAQGCALQSLSLRQIISLLEAAAAGQAAYPDAMRIRRSVVEHPFGTLKAWMGKNHFLNRTLSHVSTEMRLHVLAYNMKRAINLLGTKTLIETI